MFGNKENPIFHINCSKCTLNCGKEDFRVRTESRNWMVTQFVQNRVFFDFQCYNRITCETQTGKLAFESRIFPGKLTTETNMYGKQWNAHHKYKNVSCFIRTKYGENIYRKNWLLQVNLSWALTKFILSCK